MQPCDAQKPISLYEESLKKRLNSIENMLSFTKSTLTQTQSCPVSF